MTDIKLPDSATVPVPAFIGTAARFAMAFVASWLISQGIADPSLKDAIITGGAGVLMGACALVWGLLQKWMAEKTRATQVTTALVLPAGSTIEDLRQALQKPPAPT